MTLALLLAFCIWIALGQPGERNGLLLFLATGLAIATWQVSLPTGLLVLALSGLAAAIAAPLRARRFAALHTLVAAADQRYRNDTCRFRDQFGTIQALQVTGDARAPRIEVHCSTIAPGDDGLRRADHRIPLHTAQPLLPPRGARQLAPLLHNSGITLLNDLSVEAKAVRAAMEGLREQERTSAALSRLAGLLADVQATLAKAPGNELLEPAIPQLQQALGRFRQEERKLQHHQRSTRDMLRKLHDFLSVPAGIQPILSFDLAELLEQLSDPRRSSELKALYGEVVELNAIYRDLCRDKLA